MYTTDQLKSKIQHNEAWSAAARQSRLLCHRPAVFSRHPPFHSRKEKLWWHLKIYYFDFSLFKKICTSLNLKMCRSGSACDKGSCCWSVPTETSGSRLSGLLPACGCFKQEFEFHPETPHQHLHMAYLAVLHVRKFTERPIFHYTAVCCLLGWEHEKWKRIGLRIRHAVPLGKLIPKFLRISSPIIINSQALSLDSSKSGAM